MNAEQRAGTRDRFMTVSSLLRSAANLTQGIVHFAALDNEAERAELRRITDDIDRVSGRLRRAGILYVPGWPE